MPTRTRNRTRRRDIGQEILRGLKEVDKDRRGRPNALLAYEVRIPDLKALRRRLNLTQHQFARRFCLNARTVQDWEQGRVLPDQTVRAYLAVIAHDHRVVEKALADQ
jgi:putative transcriptional regulator